MEFSKEKKKGPKENKPIPSSKINEKERKKYIEEYTRKDKCRELLCRPWMRGLCIFTNNSCRYAHGVGNLHYIKPQDLPKDYVQPVPPLSFKMNIGETLKGLVVFQDELIKKDMLKANQRVVLKVVEENKDVRKNLRLKMRQIVTEDFLNLFFSIYEGEMVTKAFLEKEAERAGVYPGDVSVHNGKIFYEVRAAVPPAENKVDLVFKLENEAEILRKIMKNCLEITKDFLSNGVKPPIASSEVYKEYYKRARPYELPLHVYLKNKGQTFDWILYQFQNTIDYVQELGIQNLQDLLYISPEREFENLRLKTAEAINLYWTEKKAYISSLANIETYLEASLPNLYRVFTNRSAFLQFARCQLIVNGNLIIFLHMKPIVIRIRVSEEEKIITADLEKKRNCTLSPDRHRGSEIEGKAEIKEGMDNSTTSKMDMIKSSESLSENISIFIVDNFENFEKSKTDIQNERNLAIDLEGQLRSGQIELLQIGLGGAPEKGPTRRIYIFDLLTISKDNSLDNQVRQFLKSILEDSKYQKIFQDCRSDSRAVHKYLNCCLNGVFDIAGSHLLYQQLIIYSDNLHLIDPSTDPQKILNNILKKIEDIKWPGLNAILKFHKASNGINIFKDEMKEKFGNPAHRPFFLERPINRSYLLYSAQDVQDLVEIKYKIISKQLGVLNKLCPHITKDPQLTRDFLISINTKISSKYAKEGCKNNQISFTEEKPEGKN